MKKYYFLLAIALTALTAGAQNNRLLSPCSNIQYMNLTVYPNPSTERFTIELPVSLSELSELTIVDMVGHVVYTKTVTNQRQVSIDASSFANGIYFIQLKDESGYYNNALLKQ